MNAKMDSSNRNPAVHGGSFKIINRVRIVIQGQVRGGKNNMIVTQEGLHFPRPTFRRWRDDAVMQIFTQYYTATPVFTEPCSARILYMAGDRRKRDIPAVMDAIWHVLERALLVADDSLIRNVEWRSAYDKAEPRVEIELWEE